MTGQTDTVVRKRRALIAVGVLLLALCAGGAYIALKGGETGGATLGGYDDMTKEEIQAELDRQARESMMTISRSPVIRRRHVHSLQSCSTKTCESIGIASVR